MTACAPVRRLRILVGSLMPAVYRDADILVAGGAP